MPCQLDETLIPEDLIRQVVWGVYRIPLLVYSAAGRLQSGAPESDEFLITLTGCRDRLLAACGDSNRPQVASTELNQVWAGVPLEADGKPAGALVLGPVYTSEVTPKPIIDYARSRKLSVTSRERLLAQCQYAPIYPYIEFARLIAVVYTLIYRQEMDLSWLAAVGHAGTTIASPADAQAYQKSRVYDDLYVHATYAFEQQIWDCIREGKPEKLRRHLYSATYGQVGPIGNNDPVRQQKNTFICAVTLATRAGIEGGLSAEVAYSLSDLYIQQVETLRDVLQIMTLNEAMLYDLAARVRDRRRTRAYSRLVNGCCNFIDERVRENLRASQVAAATGFSADHVARKFKQETGRSIRDYIREAKVSEAKSLLKYSELSLAEISELLSFSSQSFFTVVFKETTGMTPGQFRETARQALVPAN